MASPVEIAGRDAVRAQVAALEHEQKAYEATTTASTAAWEASLDSQAHSRLAPVLQAALATPVTRRTEAQKIAIRAAFLAQDPGYQQRGKTIKALREQEPKFVKTHVARELAAHRTTQVLRRGEVSNPGDAVLPGVPAVLPPIAGPDLKGRLDLARWLVAPNHPLTARVFVNRVWEHYFGEGLVPTEDNFGLSGEPPSQPELLDWLAAEFIASGWSMKALHRLIVGSATYRQSSHIRPELAGIDPSNRLLARQTRLRLEAEAIRDCALAVSGLLSRKIGGPSVFPYQPEGIMTGRADQGTWVVRARRGSLPAGHVHTLLEVDAPSLLAAFRCARRHSRVHPADPVKYSAASLDPAERSDVHRVRPGPGGPHLERVIGGR